MIEALDIPPGDAVIDFAPSLVETVWMTLTCKPASDTAVERDNDAVALVQRFLRGPGHRVAPVIPDEPEVSYINRGTQTKLGVTQVDPEIEGPYSNLILLAGSA